MSKQSLCTVYISQEMQQAVIDTPAYIHEITDLIYKSLSNNEPYKAGGFNSKEQAKRNIQALRDNKQAPVYIQYPTSKGRVCFMLKNTIEDTGKLFKRKRIAVELYTYRPTEEPDKVDYINLTQWVEEAKSKL